MRFGSVELLEFAPTDARTLFDLRNHPAVRAFMPSREPLVFAAHVQWVTQNLVRGGPLRIFIIRDAVQPIGFTVLKRVDATCFEIGLILAEAARHPGLAAQTAALMLHLSFEHLDAAFVVTHVNIRHERAIALNRVVGEEVPSSKPNELCFRATREKVSSNRHYQRVMERLQRTLRIETVPWP